MTTAVSPVTAPSAPSFENRIRPDQISPEIRKRLARDETLSEIMCIGWTLVVSLAMGFGFTMFTIWYGYAKGHEIPFLGVLICAALIVALGIHAAFAKRRGFILHAPATTGLVTIVEPTWRYCEQGTYHVPDIYVRYLPGTRAKAEDAETLRSSLHARSTKIRLIGHCGEFCDHVKAGGLLSLLYDPKKPERVRAVEFEKAG